jgi:hypothetical protein
MRKVHSKLARHDLRQRRLAKARGPVKQDVVHRLAAAPGAFGEHPQVGARVLLADEIVKRLRPQRAVGILGQALGRARVGSGFGHRHPL